MAQSDLCFNQKYQFRYQQTKAKETMTEHMKLRTSISC